MDLARVGSGSRRKAQTATGLILPSVTEVINCLPKPHLNTWKMKQIAEAAVRGDCEELPVKERIACLVAAAEAEGKSTADTGTAVHEAIAGMLIDGQIFSSDDMPSKEAWKLFQQWLRWRDVAKPEPILIETTLVNKTLGVCGACDLVAKLVDGSTWICDWKRGKVVRASYAIQASAYRGMEFYIDGNNELQPMPEISKGGILLLGAGRFEEVQCDGPVFAVFRALLRVHKFSSLEALVCLGEVSWEVEDGESGIIRVTEESISTTERGI